MRLLSLKLRGAVGIYKGMALDEVTLNFEQFDNGLIALVARNGKGKTTILDNLHPFRTLPSRDGFVEHFRLKDSYRILTVLHNNKQYEFKILVDAITRKSEAYAFCDGVALNDGKLTTYDAVIHELFGSEQLFFASVFSAQKSSGISKMTAGERKRLFFELLGLDKYEGYEKYAKASAAEAEKSLLKLEAEMNTMKPLYNTDDVKSVIEKMTGELDVCRKNLEIEQADYDSSLSELTKVQHDIAQLAETERQNTLIERQIYKLGEDERKANDTYDRAKRNCQDRITQLERVISDYRGLASGIAAMEKDLRDMEEAKARISEDKNKILKLVDAERKINTEHTNKKAECDKIRAELVEKNNTVNSLRLAKKQASDSLEAAKRNSELLNSVPCGDQFTGCKFISTAYSDSQKIKGYEVDLLHYHQELDDAVREYRDLENEHDELLTTAEDYKKTELSKLYKKRDYINDGIARDEKIIKIHQDVPSLLSKAKDAETEIRVIEEKIKTVEQEKAAAKSAFDTAIDSIAAKIAELRKQIKPVEYGKLRIREFDLTEKREKIAEVIKSYNIRIEELLSLIAKNEHILQLEERAAKSLLELKPVHEALGKSLAEWQFLAKSFGKAGIPIMKLEHSAALVTVTANDLLALFDSKFRIKIETMTLKSDGKSFKETFDILVIDEEGEPTDLSNKSGGQQVWIESAIQMAIALVVRKQGKPIKVEFMDEKDGALDPENALNYIRMVQESARISGVEQSFIITHRPELLDLVPQQIHLTNDNTIEYLG